MWDSTSPTHYRCDATTARGKDCRGIAHTAVWCFTFQDWQAEAGDGAFGMASWWDVCNVHLATAPQRIVASRPIYTRRGR